MVLIHRPLRMMAWIHSLAVFSEVEVLWGYRVRYVRSVA